MIQPTVSSSDKYQKIMEVMSNKTLNQGLLIKITIPNGKKLDFYLMEKYHSDDIYRSFEIPVFGKMQLVTGDEIRYNKSIEIIGHPLHIGVVLDYIDKKQTWGDGKDKVEWRQEVFGVLLFWKNKRLPLSPTDEELIDYIYNLLP